MRKALIAATINDWMQEMAPLGYDRARPTGVLCCGKPLRWGIGRLGCESNEVLVQLPAGCDPMLAQLATSVKWRVLRGRGRTLSKSPPRDEFAGLQGNAP